MVRFTDEDKRHFPASKVMIVDTIGHLSSIYKYGDVAYIGGGFGSGIHNILEAATYYLPVIFGPNYHKFNEAVELIEKKAAFSISDYNGLSQKLDEIFNTPDELKECSQRAGDFVRSKLGATEQILDKSLDRKSVV